MLTVAVYSRSDLVRSAVERVLADHQPTEKALCRFKVEARRSFGHDVVTKDQSVVVLVHGLASYIERASAGPTWSGAVVTVDETSMVTPGALISAMRAGAIGAVSLADDLIGLPAAAYAAAQLRPYLSPALVEILLCAYRADASIANLGTLSERESAVLRLLCRGFDDARISSALGVEPRTVRHHLGNIYDKVGFRTRYELVAWAYRSGFVM